MPDRPTTTSTRPAPRVWLQAARPRTLPAAVAPVLVGTAAASQVVAWRAAAALVVALAVQVAVNFANDYFDGVRGVDTPDRMGPRRAVASGDASPAAMKVALTLALAVAAVAGLALAAAAGWELVVVGAVCFAAALGYSGGPRPYASAGLGEVFVFVFFGLVATVGSQYVHDERIAAVAVVAAVPIGLLTTAILVVNNLRDIPTDLTAAKVTLAVRLGERRTRALFATLVVAAGVLTVAVCVTAGTWWPLLALFYAPLAYVATSPVLRGATGPGLIPSLVATGQAELVFAAGLAAGLFVAR